jgi:hypothetical protein
VTTEDPYPLDPSRDDVDLEPAASRFDWWRELLAGLGVLLAVVSIGALVGVIWSELSPRVLVQMTADGPVLANAEPKEYMGADAVFTLLGVAVGVGLGVLCWVVLRRWRGPVVLIALAVGSLMGACLAWQLGRRIGLADYMELRSTAQVGWQFYRPPSMNSGGFIRIFGLPLFPRGALAAQALAAAFTYTMLAGWSKFPGLRPDRSEVNA